MVCKSLKSTFMLCSKLTFVPTQNCGIFVFEHRFFGFLSQNRSKRLDFAYFKPILAYFLVRQTTDSTWVKSTKGLEMVEKWGV